MSLHLDQTLFSKCMCRACVPFQALLQDTEAAPPPPPISTSPSTDSKIEPRVPAAVVLQGVPIAYLCCTKTYLLTVFHFGSHGILTADVFVLSSLSCAMTKVTRCKIRFSHFLKIFVRLTSSNPSP